MGLEERLDEVSVAKGLAPLMQVKRFSAFRSFIENPISFVPALLLVAYAKHVWVYDGESWDPKATRREAERVYASLGLSTQQEKYAWHFSTMLSSHLYADLYCNPRPRPTPNLAEFEETLRYGVKQSMNVLEPHCYWMHGDQVAPDFEMQAYSWLTRTIRNRVEKGDLRLFGKIQIVGGKEVRVSCILPSYRLDR